MHSYIQIMSSILSLFILHEKEEEGRKTNKNQIVCDSLCLASYL